MNSYNNHTEEEKPDVRKEKVVFEEDPEYETVEEEEEANREYVEKVSHHIAKLVEDENIVNDAITCYHDPYFYQDVYRQNINVWIKWYKTKYLESQYISSDDAEKQLARLSRLYEKHCRKRIVNRWN